MNKTIFFTALLIGSLLIFGGCRKQIRPTTISVKDSIRHYYPILQGQDLDLVFNINNSGITPLVIKEIQTSCGCIVLNKKKNIIVPAGENQNIHLTYNSTKNIGLVSHTIRIYGNIIPYGVSELKFDVNVVPDADYTRDYEELFRDYNIRNGIVHEMVDGKESERGYYIENP